MVCHIWSLICAKAYFKAQLVPEGHMLAHLNQPSSFLLQLSTFFLIFFSKVSLMPVCRKKKTVINTSEHICMSEANPWIFQYIFYGKRGVLTLGLIRYRIRNGLIPFCNTLTVQCQHLKRRL